MERILRLCGLCVVALVLSGFDYSKHNIPVNQIRGGGPPKDGIPAILDPRFMSAEEATFLRPEDRLIGVVEGSVAKAYPLRILTWHEVVNDTLGDKPIAVTY